MLARLRRRWRGYPNVDELLADPRRHSLVITAHVKQQAGARYGQGDTWAIAGDVCEAFLANRVGKKTPDGQHHARRSGVLAWNADISRVYVIVFRQRQWVVLTAFPTGDGAPVGPRLHPRGADVSTIEDAFGEAMRKRAARTVTRG